MNGKKVKQRENPGSGTYKNQDIETDAAYAYHLDLLKNGAGGNDVSLVTTPIFTASLRKKIDQYGLIAGQCNLLERKNGDPDTDPRLFYNIAAPFSAFICGSQGSGKSHTLSCFLENSLANSQVSKVKTPLSALLFHYDEFIGDMKGNPCEAAYLGSNPKIKVRVLCSPTNIKTIQVSTKLHLPIFHVISFHPLSVTNIYPIPIPSNQENTDSK